MHVQRVGPITKNLQPHNYNLRSKSAATNKNTFINDRTPQFLKINKPKRKPQTVQDELIDFNLNNLFPDNMAAAPVAPVQLNEVRGMAPSKFFGLLHDNGAWWLQKFEAYMARLGIQCNHSLSELC